MATVLPTRYSVPKAICDSGEVVLVSTEPNREGHRLASVEGDTIYWVEPIVAGVPYAMGRFAVGKIELASWTPIEPTTEEKLAAAEIELKELRNGK